MKSNLPFQSSYFAASSESQDKSLTILRTERAFEVKLIAVFIIFKGLSVAKNCLRPESTPLKLIWEILIKPKLVTGWFYYSVWIIVPLSRFATSKAGNCLEIFYAIANLKEMQPEEFLVRWILRTSARRKNFFNSINDEHFNRIIPLIRDGQFYEFVHSFQNNPKNF